MKLIGVFFILALAGCGSSGEASAAGDVDPPANPELMRAIAGRSDLEAAEAAIEHGHPWKATQTLAKSLTDSAKRTPAALLVSARAAAGWGGWAQVDSLLSKQAWVDAQFRGEGRELLTRSALERGADTLALRRATLALRDARDAGARATRLVLLARAQERNNLFDSASANYARAEKLLPSVRDWLALRAAGSEVDSAKRAHIFARVSSAPAKARIGWTEAETRERFADALGAAAKYAALGAQVTAYRLRLSVAPDSGARQTIKSELMKFIRAHSGSGDAKSAVEVLDKAFTSNTPAEELIIARSSAVSGPASRAVTAFSRALSQPSLVTANDRLLYGESLARAGRSRDALAQLALVEGPLAGEAAYQRARVLLTSGTADATRAALRDVVAHFPSDTSAASSALYLLADLSTDDGNDDEARTLFRRLYATYPTVARAGDARFHVGIIDFAHDDMRSAAAAFDSLPAVMPRADDALAARYWSGRAWAAAGNDKLAEARWRAVLAQSPNSYYGMLSAARLRVAAWRPPARADSFPTIAAVDSAMARAALLEQLGMDVEARFEYDALEASASGSPDRLIATAHAFLDHDQPTRAIRLAQRAIDGGQRDARSYRLLYPLIDAGELTRDAKDAGLDPALVAGLIRQESNFYPRAVSVAGARGLMQVLPSVGEAVAHELHFPVWTPALLFEPDANLELGMRHLATFSKQYGPLPRVLAAYNAGGSRVNRWVTKAGMDDPELFAERVPFAETRDYVRVVQRNAEMYRSLYRW